MMPRQFAVTELAECRATDDFQSATNRLCTRCRHTFTPCIQPEVPRLVDRIQLWGSPDGHDEPFVVPKFPQLYYLFYRRFADIVLDHDQFAPRFPQSRLLCSSLSVPELISDQGYLRKHPDEVSSHVGRIILGPIVDDQQVKLCGQVRQRIQQTIGLFLQVTFTIEDWQDIAERGRQRTISMDLWSCQSGDSSLMS